MATFTAARSTSRGRVHEAQEEIIKQIDDLTSRITVAVARLELEIGSIKIRLDSFDRRITQERDIRAAEIAALRAELAESNRISREGLRIAKEALDHAQNHAHRYNPGLDWRTAKAYKCDASTPQWEI